MCRPQLCLASSAWAGLSSVICLISHDLSLFSIPLSLSFSNSQMCGQRAGSITISTYRWAAIPVMLVSSFCFFSEVQEILHDCRHKSKGVPDKQRRFLKLSHDLREQFMPVYNRISSQCLSSMSFKQSTEKNFTSHRYNTCTHTHRAGTLQQ